MTTFSRDDLRSLARVEQLLRQMAREQADDRREIAQLRSDLARQQRTGITESDLARIRAELAAGGQFPLPLTALPGIAMKPQKAEVKEYTVLPNINDPGNYDGQLVMVANVLYRFRAGNPGSWVAMVAAPASSSIDARINSGGSTFTRQRLNVITGTDRLSLALADDSGNNEIDLTLGLPANNDVSAICSGATVSVGTGAWTALTLSAETRDTDDFHDGGTNPTRLTFPITGVYLVTGFLLWAANATGQRGARISTGGSSVWSQSLHNAASAGETAHSVTALIAATASNYTELEGYQSSSGNLDASVFGLSAALIY